VERLQQQPGYLLEVSDRGQSTNENCKVTMIVDTHEIYLELPAMIIDIYSVACFYTNTKKIVFVLSWELIIPVYL
jgi:hypothetical protein